MRTGSDRHLIVAKCRMRPDKRWRSGITFGGPSVVEAPKTARPGIIRLGPGLQCSVDGCILLVVGKWLRKHPPNSAGVQGMESFGSASSAVWDGSPASCACCVDVCGGVCWQRECAPVFRDVAGPCRDTRGHAKLIASQAPEHGA